MEHLKNLNVVITAGASGVGSEMAISLNNLGSNVTICDKDSDAFSEEIYIQFKKVYAEAFREIALEFLKRGGKKIYYPSSVAVEQDIKGMEEYKMAKKEGELVCNDLNVRFPFKILIDRLDRVNTDQTLSIMPTKSLDPYKVAIKIANMMK